MSQPFPYYYRAYGLNIASEIPVIGFESARIDKPDVVIKLGSVPKNLDNIINQSKYFQSNNFEFLLRINNQENIYVHNGDSIILKSSFDKNHNNISVYIIGMAFGAIMHQRRLLPLHASTIVYKDKCLVFAGSSGSGKSTIAATFLKYGASFVADDVSVIDFTQGQPSVRPAFPTLKIWSDSLQYLGIESYKLARVQDELQKYYLPVDLFNKGLFAISQVFILLPQKKSGIEINSLNGIAKFLAIKKNTYLFRGISKTGMEQNFFTQVNLLAHQVPVSTIVRPIGALSADEMVLKITESI